MSSTYPEQPVNAGASTPAPTDRVAPTTDSPDPAGLAPADLQAVRRVLGPHQDLPELTERNGAPAQRRLLLLAALTEAGVELGDYDHTTLDVLAHHEAGLVVVGWIVRAQREALRAAAAHRIHRVAMIEDHWARRPDDDPVPAEVQAEVREQERLALELDALADAIDARWSTR